MVRKKLFAEITPDDYSKLEKIVSAGRYATKVDFIRTKIRQEKIDGNSK
jgi:Arc/MetJ-type ribon-helix-helix transcriptional regulator